MTVVPGIGYAVTSKLPEDACSIAILDYEFRFVREILPSPSNAASGVTYMSASEDGKILFWVRDGEKVLAARGSLCLGR